MSSVVVEMKCPMGEKAPENGDKETSDIKTNRCSIVSKGSTCAEDEHV